MHVYKYDERDTNKYMYYVFDYRIKMKIY